MQDDEAPDDPANDAAPAAPPRRTILDLLSDPKRRPQPATGGPSSAAQKQIVDGLDGLERGLGFASVCFAVLVAVLSYVASKHSSTKSIHDAANFLLVSNLVFAGILALGLALKRRALLGFGCFFFGLEEAFSYHSLVLGLPFLVLGGWLILRANRKQRLDREARGPRPRPGAKAPERRGPSTPKASKRYTPPRRASSSRRR